MNDNEQKLSDYIDSLNAEQTPDDHEHSTQSEELKELYRTARLVRSLKEPVMPGPGYERELVQSVKGRLAHAQERLARYRKTGWIAGVAGIAAACLLLLNVLLPLGRDNAVHAMEEAFRKVGAYHGVLEVVSTSADGQSQAQSKLEVWADREGHYYVQGLEGTQRNVVTVNNGEQKWQIRPDERQVHLFPALADSYRFQFELGREIEQAKRAQSVASVGEEAVTGRAASIVEVTPQGGLPYRIWIDKETKLPLRKQTAMHNALQYTMTYTTIEFAATIPQELLAYSLPEGFAETNTNPELLAADPNEAEQLLGFASVLPESIPSGYVQERLAVVAEQHQSRIYYNAPGEGKQIVIEQSPADGELRPAADAILGSMNGGIVEIRSAAEGNPDIGSIRWQQNEFEFVVRGDAPMDTLAALAESVMAGPLETPSLDEPVGRPQIEVPYDLAVEQNDQQSVDAGSSPWRLDPLFTAQVFASLQMSPEGIAADYPISVEELEMIHNNGISAVVAVHNDASPVKKVYLERLVRQDDTGIWTVVGYDR